MKKIMLIDPEKCTGCGFCMLACSFAKEKLISPSKGRITPIWFTALGISVPMVCLHCAQPPCADVCPVGAITRDEATGAMILDQDRCIGCRSCMTVCPFGGVVFNDDARIMIKCDLCGGDPECVKYCVYGALSYVTADEAASSKRRKGAERLAELISKIVE